MDQAIWGIKYRLERGKGYGEARWGVLSRDGRTEIAAGLMYDDAKRIFDSCELSYGRKITTRVTLNPRIIDLEEENRAEARNRRRKRETDNRY